MMGCQGFHAICSHFSQYVCYNTLVRSQRIFLIRHAATAWNASDRMQGRTDVPLSEQGRQQAARTGAAFRDIPLQQIFTSPLSRAAETAQAISHYHARATFTSSADLLERSFGVAEGLTFTETLALYPQLDFFRSWTLPEFRPDKGESLNDVLQRVRSFIAASLGSAAENIAVISHGVTLRVLIAELCGIPLAYMGSPHFYNAGITALSRTGETGYEISCMNYTGHLEQA